MSHIKHKRIVFAIPTLLSVVFMLYLKATHIHTSLDHNSTHYHISCCDHSNESKSHNGEDNNEHRGCAICDFLSTPFIATDIANIVASISFYAIINSDNVQQIAIRYKDSSKCRGSPIC